MEFEAWMRKVDAELVKRCGLQSSDIDDWRYRDDFENRVTPARSAARALRNAKEACGM